MLLSSLSKNATILISFVPPSTTDDHSNRKRSHRHTSITISKSADKKKGKIKTYPSGMHRVTANIHYSPKWRCRSKKSSQTVAAYEDAIA